MKVKLKVVSLLTILFKSFKVNLRRTLRCFMINLMSSKLLQINDRKTSQELIKLFSDLEIKDCKTKALRLMNNFKLLLQ